MGELMIQHFNREREPLVRSKQGELCQDCLLWGRETVLNPLGDCPRCDAPTLERDDTRDEMVRNALGRA